MPEAELIRNCSQADHPRAPASGLKRWGVLLILVSSFGASFTTPPKAAQMSSNAQDVLSKERLGAVRAQKERRFRRRRRQIRDDAVGDDQPAQR